MKQSWTSARYACSSTGILIIASLGQRSKSFKIAGQSQSQSLSFSSNFLHSFTLSLTLFPLSTHPSSSTRTTTKQRSSSREAESCVRDYVKRCYNNPLMKQYFAIMMRGPSALLKKSCAPSGVREVLRHADCLEASKKPLDRCTVQAIADTVRVSKADPKLFLSASCCHVSKAKECTLKAVTSTCSGDSLEYMKAEMKAFQGEAFDLACGNNYDHRSAKCLDILRQLPPLDRSQRLPKSILPVTLKIMSQFLS